jgi:eukaryotic-like serine/threonine-protein kinase
MNHEPRKTERLGRYYLMDLLAYGGMAEIYRAKTFDNEGREYVVVIKRVLSNLATNEELINMLVHEARIATMIHHPCVVRVYEFCQVQDDYFIVMELVDGKDLKTILERTRQNETPIPISDAVYVAICTLAGLHTAHILKDSDGRALQLIHRDMSPSNILISYTGEVKICDFGIAKTNVSSIQTRIGVVRGKVKYMSPEQAMGWKLDLRTDIYSVGSVLYEMLTNSPPFVASNEVEMLKKIKEGRFVPLRQANPAAPPMLQSIVHKALSKDRMSRYQSAAEFSQALKQFLNNFAPTYTPAALAAWMEESFRSEHQDEQAAAGRYVFTPEAALEVSQDVGVNLLAEGEEDAIIPLYMMSQPVAQSSPDEVPAWLMRETTQVFEVPEGLLEGEPTEGPQRETDQFDTRDLLEGGQMTPTAVPMSSHTGETDEFSLGPTLHADSPAIPLIESSEPEIIEKSGEPTPDEDFILRLSDDDPLFDEANIVPLGQPLSPSPVPSAKPDAKVDGNVARTGETVGNPVGGASGEFEIAVTGNSESPTGETDLVAGKTESPTGETDLPAGKTDARSGEVELSSEDLSESTTPLPFDGTAEEPDMLSLDDLEEPEVAVTTGNPSNAFTQGEIVLGGDDDEPPLEDRPVTIDLDPFTSSPPRSEGSSATIDLDPFLPRSPGKPERDTSPGTNVNPAELAREPGPPRDPGPPREETGDFVIELTMTTDSASGSSYFGEISLPDDPSWGGSTNPSVKPGSIVAEDDPPEQAPR